MMARRRARDDDGRFLGDDLSTPEVNEAFEPPAPVKSVSPVTPVEPTRRRKADAREVVTPIGKVTIRQAAPRLTGQQLLSRFGEAVGAITEAEADQAVQIAHASLEAYVGSSIPLCPAPAEQEAILLCAAHLIMMGWNRPGRILREREIPAASRGPMTYRLLGRRRPSVYNPQRIGGPVGGVTRLHR
jgi:hypothetical protein